jgi:hypothetical protein
MTQADTEKFRLRHFVEKLVQQGECTVHDDPIDLIDIAAVLDCNPNAVWFRSVGPERTELVGNVMGSRCRLAAALDTDEAGFPAVLRERLKQPHKPIEVPSSEAPVHEVVLTGEDADLTTLPVHLQHGLDGAPYISASIDYAYDSTSSFTNIGCRRMMLRGPRAAGIDLVAPSDLRAIYQAAVAKGKRLPVAFTVGSHPADFLAAVASTPPMDELEVIGAVRGAPLPVVKCVTNDVKVPADAELVLEGYLDERGHVEPEGPYGEYIGYYGLLKSNPVFHLTAITRRKDALFQTVSIGGARLGYTDTAPRPKPRSGASCSRRSASRWRCAARRRRAACTTCGSRCASAIPAKRATPSPRCSALRATSNTCSSSTTISTSSPTSRSTGHWRHASRPTATSSWRQASAACRSTRRYREAAPERRPASTAPSHSARATASSSRCRTRRSCRNGSARL